MGFDTEELTQIFLSLEEKQQEALVEQIRRMKDQPINPEKKPVVSAFIELMVQGFQDQEKPVVSALIRAAQGNPAYFAKQIGRASCWERV